MNNRRSKKGVRINQTRARTALRMVLIQTRSLDVIDADSLSRSYRVDRREVDALLAEEQLRRGRP